MSTPSPEKTPANPTATPALITFMLNDYRMSKFKLSMKERWDLLSIQREHELEEARKSIDAGNPDIALLRELERTMEWEKALNEFISEWIAVMTVTFAETYLQDVLAYCASIDAGLMGTSDQRATYAELCVAASVEEVKAELRSRWADNWLRTSGPAGWIKRLHSMGARGYEPDCGDLMEELWGLRHVVVHRAGEITPDFVRYHPSLGYKAGDKLKLSFAVVDRYSDQVGKFVKTTDAFLCNRYNVGVRTVPPGERGGPGQ